MIIIAGYLPTAATNRDAAVATSQPMVGRARCTSECIDLHVSADPPDVASREMHVDLFRTERT